MSAAETIDAEDMDPYDWVDLLESRDVAVHFYLEADHEWWLVHRSGKARRPFMAWSRYPTGTWDGSQLMRDHLIWYIEELYWVHDDKDHCDIYEAKVVDLEDAPEFVRRFVLVRLERGRSQ